MTELTMFFAGTVIVSSLLLRKHQMINRLYLSISISFVLALLFFLDVVYDTLKNVFPNTIALSGDGIGVGSYLSIFFIDRFGGGLTLILHLLWFMTIIVVMHAIFLVLLRIAMMLRKE